jgi:hypothetical protein
MKSPSRKRLLGAAILLLALALIPVLNRKDRAGTPPSSPTVSADGASLENPPPARPRPGRDRGADRLLAAEGALTDATLSTFPEKEYQHIRPPAGKAAGAPVGDAYIHVPSAGRRIAMEANQLGEFPAVAMELNDTVGVRLQLDAVKPGTPVRVVIMDGGSFPSAEGVSQVIKAAEWRGVAFEFTTSGNIGTHRVLVQAAGQPSRILDFTATTDS